MLQKLGILILLTWTTAVLGDDCNLSISGKIVDEHDSSPLGYATVYISETGSGTMADSLGNFEFSRLCPGTYTCIIEHLGCTPDTQTISISRSVYKNFYLEHHAEELAEVVSLADKAEASTPVAVETLEGAQLERLQGKDLASMLSVLSGVRVLRTGSSISKPVIHGLYGDRLGIISNGVMLESQDWGTEHAPEVDPFAAAEISVVKGSSSLEYSTQTVGGLILLEPARMSLHPGYRAGIRVVESSNGWGTGVSGQFEQGIRNCFAYRLQGTYKRSGDMHAPNYVMSNTGQQEGDLTLQTHGHFKDWDLRLNYTLYSQEIGILRASHIGNVTDLIRAIGSEEPLIIRDATFAIDNPRQQVRHQVASLRLNKPLGKFGYADVRFSFQSNNRREYDVRRGGRSDIPALDMRLNSTDLRPSYVFEKTFEKGWHYELRTGLNYQYKYNFNDPQTGIVPLIPDYQNHLIGAFATQQLDKDRFLFEAGARYEWNGFEAYTFDRNTVVKQQYRFHSYAANAGARWTHPVVVLSANLGMSQRNPNASELFSDGLHHGLAVLEYGDPNLNSEKSLNATTLLQFRYRDRFQAEFTAYVNPIRDYIYQQPDSAPVLTIRGAFPAFLYKQTDALLAGLDISLTGQPFSFWSLGFNASLVRGRDQVLDDWLIYMPADHLAANTEFFFDHNNWKHSFFRIETEYTFYQPRTPESIPDYKAAPPAYALLNLSAGTTLELSDKHQLDLSLTVENALNKTYRDYLNRFRYYTDEAGISVILRLNYHFG